MTDQVGAPMDMRSRQPLPSAKAEASGAGAVREAKKMRAQQNNVSLDAKDDEAIATGAIKRVGVKTFYLTVGGWIDGDYDTQSKLPEVKLKFASDEYFNLLKQEKELAQYFAQGEQVVVVWKGKVYRVEN